MCTDPVALKPRIGALPEGLHALRAGCRGVNCARTTGGCAGCRVTRSTSGPPSSRTPWTSPVRSTSCWATTRPASGKDRGSPPPCSTNPEVPAGRAVRRTRRRDGSAPVSIRRGILAALHPVRGPRDRSASHVLDLDGAGRRRLGGRDPGGPDQGARARSPRWAAPRHRGRTLSSNWRTRAAGDTDRRLPRASWAAPVVLDAPDRPGPRRRPAALPGADGARLHLPVPREPGAGRHGVRAERAAGLRGRHGGGGGRHGGRRADAGVVPGERGGAAPGAIGPAGPAGAAGTGDRRGLPAPRPPPAPWGRTP
ncbi:hypothetical protein SMICM304S_12122 [Streptomyces microflavus]